MRHFILKFCTLSLSIAIGVNGVGCSKEEPAPTQVVSEAFNETYTTTNSIAGKWRIEKFKSERTDSSSSLMKDLVEGGKSRVLMTVVDAGKAANVSFDIHNSNCHLQIELKSANYCCMKMLRLSMDPKNPTVTETPAGCVHANFGQTANELSGQILNALLESPTSSMPQIYHFNHNQSQERVRLQNPPPVDKKSAIPKVETELYLELVK